MSKRFVLAFQHLLDHLLVVVLNVHQVLNALKTKHALTKNVVIHAQVHADQIPVVKLSITVQYVVVYLNIQEILSQDVHLYHVSLTYTRSVN